MSHNFPIPDPRDVPFTRWVGEICLLDPNVPFAQSDTQWRRWAASLVDITELAEHNIPNPNMFRDWREWAVALKNSLG